MRLHVLAWVQVVDELLAAGCDLDSQNSGGNTGLHLAAAKGEFPRGPHSVLQLLLELGPGTIS